MIRSAYPAIHVPNTPLFPVRSFVRLFALLWTFATFPVETPRTNKVKFTRSRRERESGIQLAAVRGKLSRGSYVSPLTIEFMSTRCTDHMYLWSSKSRRCRRRLYTRNRCYVKKTRQPLCISKTVMTINVTFCVGLVVDWWSKRILCIYDVMT